MKMNPIVTLNIKKASYAFYKLLFCDLGPRQESNLHLQNRNLKYYPLYYEALSTSNTIIYNRVRIGAKVMNGYNLRKLLIT
jgi:hypothetical protein